MFRCENCGTGFNATVASGLEHCPRCKAGGIEARLSFRLFEAERRAGSGEAETKTGGTASKRSRS